jgi:cell division protein FtsN
MVQVGSYRDPENARYMVRDLKGAGFAAEIQEKKLNGNVYYRVVIGPAVLPSDAESLMLRLKEAGFEGFLLFPD